MKSLINKYKRNIFIPLAIFVITFIVAQFYILKSLNNNIYDLFLFLNRSDSKQNDIVILQQSINSIDKANWSRKNYSDLLEKLAQYKPKVVGIYLKFYTPSNESDDKIFLSSLKLLPVVILDTSLNLNKQGETEFWKTISKLTRQGHDFLPKDNDNVIRNQFLLLNFKPSFPLAVINRFDSDKYKYTITRLDKNTEQVLFKDSTLKSSKGTLVLPITYKHNNTNFNIISFKDFLSNKYPKNFFKDKIVLVGLVVDDLYGNSITPFSKQQPTGLAGTVSPLLVQAQVIDSLMHNDFIKDYPRLLLFLLVLLFIFLTYNIFKPYGIIKQIIIFLLIIPLVVLTFSFLVFKLYNTWFAPVEFLLSSILCFIALSAEAILTTSNFLDKLIGQLDTKKYADKSDSLDHKLSNLIELVNIVQNDKDFLNTVLTSVNSPIIIFNEKGNIIYSNKSYYNAELVNINNLSNEINLDELKQVINKESSFKKNIILKDSHFQLFSCMTKNNIYLCVLNDITDMVKMNEMKSNILRMLSHELKTPLASIMLCIESIQISEKRETVDKFMSQIEHQVTFVEKMIQDFLALSKLEIVDFELNKESLQINNFISSIIEELNLIAADKKIQIDFIPDEEINNIAADKRYLYITLKNLVDNALKYSPVETKITVKTSNMEENVLISIKDQGFGIPEKDLKNLFTKFYRVKSDKTKSIKGSGLGLSFVKRIIELHNGDINVLSKENEGSEFLIKLPIN